MKKRQKLHNISANRSSSFSSKAIWPSDQVYSTRWELAPVEQAEIQPGITWHAAYFKSRMMCLLLEDHLK